jgi:hypothetical protein
MPFVKGQIANPDGARKRMLWDAALKRAIAQDDGKRLRASAEKLLDLASEGEKWACEMLAERLDGKVAQAIALSGDVGIRRAADLSDDALAEIANARTSS